MLHRDGALRRIQFGVTLAAALTALASCSDSTDEAPAEAATPPEPEKVLMQDVMAIDLGRTFDSVMISVEGHAPGLGYQNPELRNHERGARSSDGYAQFDFVALPPDEELAKTLPAPGSDNALKLRANREVPFAVLQGLRGVRVFTAKGVATRPF